MATHCERGNIRSEIRPDMELAVAEFDELRELSARFGFDLLGTLHSLAESFAPVWCCDVDDSAAATTGYSIARYKLCDRLHGMLTAFRAWNGKVDAGKIGGHADYPIEITSEMIEEGACVLAHSAEPFAHHPFELLKPIVAEVYESMVEIYREKKTRHSASIRK